MFGRLAPTKAGASYPRKNGRMDGIEAETIRSPADRLSVGVLALSVRRTSQADNARRTALRRAVRGKTQIFSLVVRGLDYGMNFSSSL